MFYTIYNVGRALSQTLALAAVQFSVSPAIISQALKGTAKAQSPHVHTILVHSIDNSFQIFIIFFLIALLLTLFLLRSQRANAI